MPNKKRFEKFLEDTIANDSSTEVACYYDDGTPMTADAKAFLNHYRQLVKAWEVITDMTDHSPVIIEQKGG